MLQAHTILPGAVNNIPCAFSAARLLTQDDSVFLVYASGNKIVFISQELAPIEKISSVDLGLPTETLVSAVCASEFRGLVAAAWGQNLFLFHTSTLSFERKTLRLEWIQMQQEPYIFRNSVHGLAWNKLGSCLLVSHGDTLCLFSLNSLLTDETQLEKKWETRLAANTRIIKYSPDGQLFATCGTNDTLVKIWYFQMNDVDLNLTRYTFSYLKHSTPVVGLSWRDTHLYMPKNGVPNAILTHTADNTAHIWVQRQQSSEEERLPIKMYHCTTIAPQINLTFISSIASDILTFAPVWVNNKVLLFTDHMIEMQKKARTHNYNFNAEFHTPLSTPAQTPINQSAPEFPARDLPHDPLQDLRYATSLLARVKAELTLLDSPLPSHVMSQLLNLWRAAPDLILAVNPLDGSILIWSLDHLDSESSSYAVKRYCLVSRIPHNVPMEEAQSISGVIGLALYPGPIEMQQDTRRCSHFPFSEQSYFSPFRAGEIEEALSTPSHDSGARSTKFLVDRLYFFTLHREGSLNVWHAILSDRGSVCNISGFVHMLATGGHMFAEIFSRKHPSLPLLATVSQDSSVGKKDHGYCSDLILWRTDQIGMLNSNGGLKQTAKLLGRKYRDFSHPVWLPTLLSMKGNLASSACIPTGTFLVTSVEGKLAVFLTLCISPLDIWSCDKETYTSINHNHVDKLATFDTFSNSNFPSFLYKLSNIIDLEEIEGEILSVQVFSEKSLRNFTPHSEQTTAAFEEFECILSDSCVYIVLLANQPNTREQLFSVFDKSEGVGDQLRTTQPYVWRCRIHFKSKLRPVSNSLLDRRVSKVTLFYDMVTRLEARMEICVDKLSSDSFRFEGERLTFVEQVSQLADTGQTHFSPFLFSTLASNGVITNWQCEVNPGAAKWVPYPSPDGGRVCLNSLMQESHIFTPSSFMHIHSVHAADPGLLAVCFEQTDAASKFIAILNSQHNGNLNWACEEVIEIAKSSSLCATQSVQVDWIPCRNGRFLLALMWGTSLSVYARRNKECVRENVQLFGDVDGGRSPLYSYVRSLEAGGGRWVRIAAFEAPLNRVSPHDVINLWHVGGGALLLSVNSVLVLLSPWILGRDTRWESYSSHMTPSHTPLSGDSEAISFSLFDIAGALTRQLPQFHPYVLLELIQAGMLEHIKSILLHLAACIVSKEQLTAGETRSRAGSVLEERSLDTYTQSGNIYDYSDLDAQLFCEEQVEVDSNEAVIKHVKYIPPLPLSTFQQSSLVASGEFTEFTPLIHKLLARHLPECRLPGLLPLEEVELQAIVDTMGNMKLLEGFGDFNPGPIEQNVPLVDECGLRYRLALKRYVHCKQHTPKKDFSKMITPGDFFWGFHSFEQEKLLKDIPSIASGNPDWIELRQAGVCWWVRSIEMLRPFIERLAKSRFSEKSDPLDAALFYLALNKKSILKHLFRTVGNSKMCDFFSNDFTEDRWKRAAKKNAFKLMSLQRFETAVAFFLLGHSIWDAVEVCIDRLQDFQLALLITRLLEGDRGEHYQRLLRSIVGTGTCEESREIPELRGIAYYRSMAYWQMDEYTSAIDTLLRVEPRCASAPICNFYFYLKAHPLICRHRRQSAGFLTQDEVRLVFSTSSHYLERGCPLLAMLILLKFDREMFALDARALMQRGEAPGIQVYMDTQINTGTISAELFGVSRLKESSKQSADSFDWSQPSFSILTSVDFEPPSITNRAADYDWSLGPSFNSRTLTQDDEYTPYETTHTLETIQETQQAMEEPSDSTVVLDLRPSLLHAKFITSLAFLCENLSKVRAVNGEVGNSAKFNTSLREIIYAELEQAASNLDICFEFENVIPSLRPLLEPLAEFLTLSQDSLATKQVPIALLYTLISTDFSHVPQTDSLASLPVFLSASLPPAHFQNLLTHTNNQIIGLFNFIKKFRFPYNSLSREVGVDMIWQQCAVISHCVLTALSSINCGYSHPQRSSQVSTPSHPYMLSTGSINNKLSSWPGVQSSEVSENTRKRVLVLLAEACGGVLLALFANAYLQQNAKLMFLLLRNMPDDRMWYEVFCGGEGPPLGRPVTSILQFYLREGSLVNGSTQPVGQENVNATQSVSDESQESDFTGPLSVYMWSIISLCGVKKVLEAVRTISAMIGIDTELPLKSPLLCQIRTQGQRWEKDLTDHLDSACGLAEQIKSASSTDSSNSSSLKSMIVRHMKAMDSSPRSEVSLQMRDTLEFLEQMDETRDVLCNYLRPIKTDPTTAAELYKPRVIFRDEDPIYGFCYSPSKQLVLAVSTSKHIYEIDISRFDSGQWVEDSDASPDDPGPGGGSSHRLEDFLVVYQPTERRESPVITGGAHEQTGAASSVLIRRSQHSVRRMEAHPELPYYLCGTQDGAVHLCQFDNEGIVQSLCKSHASITAIHFTHQGNKFGILDRDGGFSSCQGIYTSMSQPQKLIACCHTRSSEDFCYLSSSSFIATCGHASDSANVRLWDLLMPPRRNIVKQFYCHPEGSTILVYSQRHQQLISGGRKGDVCIFDIRQQSLIQRIEAHSDAVRAIALNASEDFYVTGCSSGSAKLWGLTVHNPIRTFSMLHPKSSIFRSEPGITHLSLTEDGYLLSSGGDGTIRRSAVHHLL